METPPGPTTQVTGSGAMAVSPHHLASQAALDVMAAGGTAVDGAIAANAMLGVVAPETCGPGGDLFAVVHGPGLDRPAALNASGRAGAGATAAALRDAGATEVPLYGPWTVTTPGCVDGWEALLDRFGKLSLAAVLEPAVAAADGFPTSAELSAALARGQERIGSQPSAAALYPEGRAPRTGQVLARPDLGRTLAELAKDGREAFYTGAVGRAIVAATEGRVTPADLARRNADWVEPLSTTAFGRTAWTVPPNSQGYLALAASRVFELLAPPTDPDHPAFLHAAVEAYRSLAWERDLLLGDPDSGGQAAAAVLDPDLLADRARLIDADRAGTWRAPVPQPGGTAFLCTVDRAGLGAALIQSNFHGIGSGLGAGATGVFLHNRGAGFCLEPGHPNEMAPGKRPLHTLSPTLWTDGDRLDLLLGTRGGHQQPQLLVHLAAHLLHAGLSPAAAQARPRWMMDRFGAGDGSAVQVEPGMPDAAVDGLRARGHDVTIAPSRWMAGWGPAALIKLTADGERTGAADPRISTAAAVTS